MSIYYYNENVLDHYSGFCTMSNETKNKFFMGVELELELSESKDIDIVAESIESYLTDHAILKQDGTLGYGFEIVTVPATLNYHRKKLWKKFFNDTDNLPYLQANSNCGLHVHFSRNAVSELTLAKMIYFVHDSSNGPFLSRVAGRTVNEHASFYRQRSKDIEELQTDAAAILYSEDADNNDDVIRGALTISNKTEGQTVEMRIFASQTTYEGVMSALEFVRCLAEYCDTCGVTEEAMTSRFFLTWFQLNNGAIRYPNLHETLVKRNLIAYGAPIKQEKVA